EGSGPGGARVRRRRRRHSRRRPGLRLTRIETDRLSLVPCPGDFAAEIGRDRSRAAQLIGVTIPDDWPHPDLAELLPVYAELVADDPGRLGFGPWLSIERAGRTLVGGAGFHGPPKEGTVEIGFDTAAAFRNRGYAAEAARALVEWALAHEDVSRVVAGNNE